MVIDSVSAIGSELSVHESDLISRNNIQSSFIDTIQQSVGELNVDLVQSAQLLEKMAMGEQISTHEVMLAMSEAKMSLQLAVEVRNKLLEAYQEVMKMPL
ncbi:flagellar hook-basal body complex protein FliE [Rheinheimera faecalis]|uniref:flagellar hook-basal body complex protein FliE n=1 Tax=Rheinheimera faecalis TaxID=2901141 RepID=UPI001E59E431|nr:flagellar hook-basal body complex protein FliE [Rheinheimera faecalis]